MEIFHKISAHYSAKMSKSSNKRRV
jgi:hypothetical protein